MYRVCGGAPSASARVGSSRCSSALFFRPLVPSRTSVRVQQRWLTAGRRGRLPSPPPLPPPPGSVLRDRAGAQLPPPPPLTTAHLGTAYGAGTTHSPSTVLRSPQEVLTTFISYIPTYYVSVPCVASVLPEELREHFIGRGRLFHFLKRFPFLFDVQVNPSGSSLVRLHRDVNHPQRGAADERYMMIDVGETTSYIAKPEYITSTESLDSAQRVVFVKPPVPPPSVQVHLEERVPVVERLRLLVPETFVSIEELEERVPEDVLFHPYFDCQGGLLSIAGKLPEELQVVDGRIRRRPRHLAPLALDEYTLETSPLPGVAAMVKRAVCDSDIPHWVSITSLYETLTREQKHELKQHFKSFASFLRAHGRALAVSTDMLQVSMWICKTPPPLPPTLGVGEAPRSEQRSLGASKPAATAETSLLPPPSSFSSRPVTYTREEVLNAWYDRFPPHKTLSLREAMELLPIEMRTSGLPTKIAPWLATHPHYFTVDYMEEVDPTKVLIRRASEWQPLDIAMALYAHMMDAKTDYEAAAVLEKVEPSLRRVVEELGMEQLGDVLPQWLLVTKRHGAAWTEGASFTLRRLQDHDALQQEIQRRRLQKRKKDQAGVTEAVDAEDMANLLA